MGRRATGQIIEHRMNGGDKTFAIRFRAYGKRQFFTLGAASEGWTKERAQEALVDVLADVRAGTWNPSAPLREDDPPLTDSAPSSTSAPCEAMTDDRLVTAAQLAEILAVDRSWVYEHAHELGPYRLGTGPKAPLRFNPREVLERLRTPPPPALEPAPVRRRHATARRPVPLLPVRGRGER